LPTDFLGQSGLEECVVEVFRAREHHRQVLPFRGLFSKRTKNNAKAA
jgi:hypothetical protein